MQLRRKLMRAMTVLMGVVIMTSTVLPLSSLSAHAAVLSVVKKFDFGSKISPVMAGFTQVHEELLYTPELGYGLDKAVVSRLRSGSDDLFNDFILGINYTFMVDVPNGEYDVTIYSGDLMTGTSTSKSSISLEGEAKGTIRAKEAVTEAKFHTTVTDGQLTVGVTGSGVGGYLNGMVIEQVIQQPPTPQGLVTDSVSASESASSVSLQWGNVQDAASYNVYRAASSSDDYVLLGSVSTTTYLDSTVVFNSSYSYKVSAVNAAGVESRYSEAITVEVKPQPPVAPSDLVISAVLENKVSLAWTAVNNAESYTIFRSDKVNGVFVAIGSSNSTNFTDMTANTSVAWYYKIKAVNVYGESAFSDNAVSFPYSAPQPLPDGTPIRFDFGIGAIEDGYIRVLPSTAYMQQLKYGFTDTTKISSADRGIDNPLKSDFVAPIDTSFVVDLPNGDYTVSVIAGDQLEATDVAIKAETIQKIQETSKLAGEYLETSFDIALIDGQLNLEFSGTAPKINAIVITKLPEREAGEKPDVYIAGDSTVQTYDEYWQPQAGWGQMIPRFFTDDVNFINRAIGGRSSKSFIEQGRLDEVLREIKPGDYFLVQFGHNDASIGNPDRYASVPDYKNYLKSYVNGARQRGATPILVTPMGRRVFDKETGRFDPTFPEYVLGMKEVAQELNVKLVDLSSLSVAYYNSIGAAATTSVFLYVEPGIYVAFPTGKEDTTHFQEYGAIQLARMLSGGIKELNLPLSAFVKDIEAPAKAPAKPTGLKASSIGNAAAVLKWDAVNGADIYKIYRKLATEDDYIMIGSSTVPTASIGNMLDNTSYDIQISAVNGRGESEMSDAISITTKFATYKFDMGASNSPVMEGYTAVTLDSIYTPEKGYGITSNVGLITRDREGGDALTNDWIGYFNNNWEFKVDVPNGKYAVSIYVGDFLGTASTEVTIEGLSYGTVGTKRSVTKKSFNEVIVTDGQINFIFGGSTGIVNGVELTPIEEPVESPAPSYNLNGPNSVRTGETFQLTYGLSNVADKVYAKSVTINYDPSLLEYVNSSSLVNGFSVVGSTYEPGTVKILEASIGTETPVTGNLDLLSITFKALNSAAATNINMSGIVLGDQFGNEVTVTNGNGHLINIIKTESVDKSGLSAIIADATIEASNAKVLNPAAPRFGYYSQDAINTFNAAITAATTVMNQEFATQAEVDHAKNTLIQALDVFRASANQTASVGDLALVAVNYHATSDLVNWQELKMYDSNNDGKLDLIDLVAMAQRILN